MISKPHNTTLNPTVYTSPRIDVYKDPTAEIFRSSTTATVTNGDTVNPYLVSNYYETLLTALSRYLPSNEQEASVMELTEINSDDFKMYEFKVRRCTSSKAHDWTECPFVHPGEKARRRDPRRFSYSGTACTDYRKGNCRRGDACDFAHGVFECWLHPTRYRTQVCKDGSNCTRRVCFFAHSRDQLRVTSGQPSPVSIGSGSSDPFDDVLELSPPLTPVNRARPGCTMGDLVATLRNLQLSKVKSMTPGSAWNSQAGLFSPRFGPTVEKAIQTGYYSLPTTPTQITSRSGGNGYLDAWEKEPVFERPIEDMQEPVYLNPVGPGPDIGWVSELLQ